MGNKGQSQVVYHGLKYLTGEAIAADGSANVPSEATFFSIAAEGGAVYYAMNAAFANTLAPGFVADGAYRLEGPIGNLNNLRIAVASGATAHIQYYS